MKKLSASLLNTLQSLPEAPGVYQFFDVSGSVLYVGKSNCLKKRVNSYFDRVPEVMRIRRMVSLIDSLQIFVTDNETEALVLEANLIRQIAPRYNVLFKDGKGYPYIRLVVQAQWPWVEKAYRKQDDGNLYYGPYTNGAYVYRLIKFLEHQFNLLKCQTDIHKNKRRLCLEYQIGRCPGPCELEISRSSYLSQVNEVKGILDGGIHQIVSAIEGKMRQAAQDLDFELAASLRDQARSLRMLTDQQMAEGLNLSNEDYFAVSTATGNYMIQRLVVREGKIVGQHKYFGELQEHTPQELLLQCIAQSLIGFSDPPSRICCDLETNDSKQLRELAAFLSRQAGHRVEVFSPRIGRMKRLLGMAQKNAQEGLRLELQKRDNQGKLLLEAREQLGLKAVPQVIECFDISNISGTNAVASMVSCVNGSMVPARYRRFKIRTRQSPDDFAMMAEAVERRISRLQKEGAPLPDMILVDGGLGQLNAAAAVLNRLQVDVDLLSLAKREELLYIFGRAEPVQLGKFSAVRLLMQRIRDEAHRFAITYHKLLRSKRTLTSELDSIPGIGPSSRQKILKVCKDMKHLRSLDEAGLKALGLPARVVQALLRGFHA